MIRTSVLAALLAVSAAAGHAATIQNGSFETNTLGFGSGLFKTIGATNSSALPGWTVDGGNIDLIRTVWTASDGNFSLDMNGTAPATIWQDLSGLTAGKRYTVFFDLAANPNMQSAVALKRLSVSAGGSSTIYEVLTSGQTGTAMGWAEQAFTFTAGSAVERLTFSSLISGYGGPALDNVRVGAADVLPAAVPLPPALGLYAAAALALGGLRRLRRRTA